MSVISQQLSTYSRTAGGAQAQSDGGRAPLGVIVLLATIHFLPQQGTNLGANDKWLWPWAVVDLKRRSES